MFLGGSIQPITRDIGTGTIRIPGTANYEPITKFWGVEAETIILDNGYIDPLTKFVGTQTVRVPRRSLDPLTKFIGTVTIRIPKL
jgi:hypothetical protein